MDDLQGQLSELYGTYTERVASIERELDNVYRESAFRVVLLEVAKEEGISEGAAFDGYLAWCHETAVFDCEAYRDSLRERRGKP